MNEVRKFQSWSPEEISHLILVVRASDFDAEHALRLEAEKELHELRLKHVDLQQQFLSKLAAELQVGALREQLAISYSGNSSLSRRNKELSEHCERLLSKLDATRDARDSAQYEVTELREKLEASERRANVAVADANDAESAGKTLSRLLSARTDRLDTAMGLLRDCYDSICNPDEYRKVGAFLNTTSTEGKDHE